ncbi:MAG: hypothetical protein DWI69_05945 [Chloroflexi bacterium]|nr:MAG: hypothetical protein DWI69_05945 [Chloroflexota bacterium]
MNSRLPIAIVLASALSASCGPMSLDSLTAHGSNKPDDSNSHAQPASERFVVASPDAPRGILGIAQTCDGRGETPAINSRGAPQGTVSFAVTMHTQVNIFESHAYLVVYDLPQSVHGLPTNNRENGIFGANSINDQREYAPPCSKGPGMKDYVVTVFALNSVPNVTDRKQGVTRQELLSSISQLTLDSATLKISYARPTNP